MAEILEQATEWGGGGGGGYPPRKKERERGWWEILCGKKEGEVIWFDIFFFWPHTDSFNFFTEYHFPAGNLNC